MESLLKCEFWQRTRADPPNDARSPKTGFQRCSQRNFNRKLTSKWTWRKGPKLGPPLTQGLYYFYRINHVRSQGLYYFYRRIHSPGQGLYYFYRRIRALSQGLYYRSAVKMHVLSAPRTRADPQMTPDRPKRVSSAVRRETVTEN